jgi:hypothetical protein
MAITPQTQAMQIANGLISAAQGLMSVYQLMLTLDAQWTDDNAATIIAAMATASQNADGSLGAADGSPNVAHPITSPLLNRAISSNSIASIKTIMDGIVAYVNGSAVTTQPGARAILNVAVGG